MSVDKSGARVQRMFGQIAPKYDRMNHLLSMKRGPLLALAYGAKSIAQRGRTDSGRVHGHGRSGVGVLGKGRAVPPRLWRPTFAPKCLRLAKRKSDVRGSTAS